jgi:predicted acyl esterase
LTFDTEPLAESLEILGAPMVELDLESNQPVAMVAVRLTDVRPDGQATRVSYGLLNLCHRNGHEHPQALEPGKRYTLRVRMNEIAQRFPAGDCIRLSFSTVYWPLAWPSPAPVRLSIHLGTSQLYLPVRPSRSQESERRAFDTPEAAPPLRKTTMQPARHAWTVIRELVRDESPLEVVIDEGVARFEDIDLEIETRGYTRSWDERFERDLL